MPKQYNEIRTTSALDQRHFATIPVAAGAQTHAPLPEWIRLPKSGTKCPYAGLSRSTLNALILGNNPPVKSRSVKKRHAVRGVRLINLRSLLEFIEAQVNPPADAEQHDTAPAEPKTISAGDPSPTPISR